MPDWFRKLWGGATVEKYVVLHSQVRVRGDYHLRGTVLEIEAGEELQRLLSLGAVRAAAPVEAPRARVELANHARPDPSMESRLAERDAEIDRLRAHAADLETKLGETRGELEKTQGELETVRKAKGGGRRKAKGEETHDEAE